MQNQQPSLHTSKGKVRCVPGGATCAVAGVGAPLLCCVAGGGGDRRCVTRRGGSRCCVEPGGGSEVALGVAAVLGVGGEGAARAYGSGGLESVETILGCPMTLPILVKEHFLSFSTGRNKNTFKGINFNSRQVWNDNIYFAWAWLKAYHKDFSYSLDQWQINLKECLMIDNCLWVLLMLLRIWERVLVLCRFY
ncbi:hypothetical protein Fmac_016702 [Flemingia macrophylla]|uniref:Uncharacterized protein n=1 Tax=Flemingia macrophylla TaxID=520843 RepID=A0ABD1MI65_9FABA